MFRLLHMACRNLLRQKKRSLLVLAGIAVGSASVILVTAIGAAGKELVNDELNRMGMNGIAISSTGDGRHPLDIFQLQLIRENPQVRAAAPVSVRMALVTMRGLEGNTMVWAVDDQAQQVVSMDLLYGRALNKVDIQAGTKVCVVDRQTATVFYQRENIVGKTLRTKIDNQELELEVVGVVATGGNFLQGMMGEFPGFIYLPYSLLPQPEGNGGRFQKILVQLQEGTPNPEEAANTLALRLGQTEGDAGAYKADHLTQQRERLGHLMTIVTMVLSAVAAVSLVVSGLGIATVMLMTVGERTQEIGIKKALGASNAHIRREFLLESTLVAWLGSLLGSVFAVVLVGLGKYFFEIKNLAIPMNVFMGMIVFSAVWGGICGAYPAAKAARLCPMEALRRGE